MKFEIFLRTPFFYRTLLVAAPKVLYFKINYKIYLKVLSSWNKQEDTVKNSEPGKHSKITVRRGLNGILCLSPKSSFERMVFEAYYLNALNPSVNEQ